MGWNQVQDELDLPALAALNRYWESYPPLHLMVAAYLEIKPKDKPAAAPPDDAELSAFLATLSPTPK